MYQYVTKLAILEIERNYHRTINIVILYTDFFVSFNNFFEVPELGESFQGILYGGYSRTGAPVSSPCKRVYFPGT